MGFANFFQLNNSTNENDIDDNDPLVQSMQQEITNATMDNPNTLPEMDLDDPPQDDDPLQNDDPPANVCPSLNETLVEDDSDELVPPPPGRDFGVYTLDKRRSLCNTWEVDFSNDSVWSFGDAL